MIHYKKRTKLLIIGVSKEQKLQVNGVDQIFNKIIDKNVLKLKRDIPCRYKKYRKHQIDKTRKENLRVIL